MVLTLVWRVNPVEGSVMPRFLTGNPMGQTLMLVLIVTCMPMWMIAVYSVVGLSALGAVPDSVAWPLASGAALALQGILYFVLGKLISAWASRFRAWKSPPPG
jgi:hypothetical protein